MKLSPHNLESYDQLPKTSKTLRDPDGYRQGNFPWKRAYRFLMSRRGQPWSHVVSEYVHADWIPVESRNLKHLRSGVGVEMDTFIEDGEVKYYDHHSYRSDAVKTLKDDEHRDVFYVHPVTNTLECRQRTKKKSNWAKRRQEELAKTCKILGDYNQVVCIHGLWFHVWIDPKKVTDRVRRNIAPNTVLLDSRGFSAYRPVWGSREYWTYDHLLTPPIEREQLRSKDLKRLGLTNNPIIEHRKLGGRNPKFVDSWYNL